MTETTPEAPALGGLSASTAEPEQPTQPSEPIANDPVVSDTSAIDYERLMGMLPEDLRNEKIFQNINRENPMEDMARQFFHAQKLVGVDKIEAPKEDWAEDKWDAFFDRLGRPKTPDDYTVPDFGENTPIDNDALNQFKQLAHKEGLTSKQAESVLKMYGEYVQSTVGKVTEQSESELVKNLSELQGELGDNFPSFLKEAEAGLKTFADENLQQLIMGDRALSNNPHIIRHFHKLNQMSREDSARSGDSTNPMSVSSPEQAINVLRKFEEDNAQLLFRRPEMLSMKDIESKERVLKRREQLYRMAFPPE